MMAEWQKGFGKLRPGDTVVGFMTRDGKLIGEFAEPSVGHDVLSLMITNLRSQLKSGQAVAITIGKGRDGNIHAFGSGTFPPPGGVLSESMKELARRLVE